MGRLKEILAIVGGALACRSVARQVVGAIPIAGWVVKGGIGYAGTVAMGRALIEYFEQGADVSKSAQSFVETLKGAPAWAGAAKDKGIVENVTLVADAAREKVVGAVGNAARNLGPTITSVASAAGDATGLTQADLANMADKALGEVRRRIGI